MPRPISSTNSSNLLLSHLSPQDMALLRPHLEYVDLPIRSHLEWAKRPVEHVYFIERGIASVVTKGKDRGEIEVGLIGREGCTGLPVILGIDQSPNDTFVQLHAAAQRIPASQLAKAIKASPTMLPLLLRHVYLFGVQVASTALANGRGRLEERLARWLLMSQDRAGSDTLEMTHEFLSVMLGVRRPGVTDALGSLARLGLIQVGRGRVTILDREGLKATCSFIYGMAEAEQERLFPEGLAGRA